MQSKKRETTIDAALGFSKSQLLALASKLTARMVVICYRGLNKGPMIDARRCHGNTGFVHIHGCWAGIGEILSRILTAGRFLFRRAGLGQYCAFTRWLKQGNTKQ